MSPVTQAAAEVDIPAALTAEPLATPAEATPTETFPTPSTQALLNDERVADWLQAHPDFFEQHADVLAEVKLRQPHGGRAISLVERQVLVLRERNKALESRMAELIRIGQENDAISRRLQQLTEDLLQAKDAARLPSLLVEGLLHGFGVPQVAVRLWGMDALDAPFGEEVSPETRRRIDELAKPYCGPNSYPEAAAWLPGGGEQTGSMAMLALRRLPTRITGTGQDAQLQPLAPSLGDAFGLIVLGSDDAARFQAGMGTAFLERIAEIAGASLSRLLP